MLPDAISGGSLTMASRRVLSPRLSGSPALLASAGSSPCSQKLLGMELARVSLGLLLTVLPHSVACSFLSACSLQVLGLGSIPRLTQQPQLNSRFFVEALHAARGNCERSLTLVGCRHFSPPTSARGSPRPQKGSGPPLSSRQGRAAW